jgi:flagellar capping protein FliD
VSAGDTNEDVQNAMRDAVNDVDVGVVATVETGTGDGTLRLRLAAADTGTDGSFTIADVTGTAVANTGVGSATTVATDAVYTIDDAVNTSSSNTISLDSGKVKIALTGTSSDEVTVTVGGDGDAITEVAESFADAYNDAVTYLSTYATYMDASASSRLSSTLTRLQASVSPYGFAVDQNGLVTVDATRLDDAVSDNFTAVRVALGDFNGLGRQMRLSASVLMEEVFDLRRDDYPGSGAEALAGAYRNTLRQLVSRAMVDFMA